jgi:hypothetical protein
MGRSTVTKTRLANPRWLWILSLLVGGICAGAFGFAMLSTPEPSKPPHAPVETSGRGAGFGLGLVIGVGVGVAIGLGIARARGGGPVTG